MLETDDRLSISGVEILPEVELGVDAMLFTVEFGGSFFDGVTVGPVDVAGAATVFIALTPRFVDFGGFPGGRLVGGGISSSCKNICS